MLSKRRKYNVHVFNGDAYIVDFDVSSEHLEDFSGIFKENEDGSYKFVTVHYNGVGWNEIMEYLISDQ